MPPKGIQADGHPPMFQRGIDGGLARAAPDAKDLKDDNYRTFRKRLDLFERCCRRRGADAVAEGAMVVLQSLSGEAWVACEECDLDRIDSAEAFDELRLHLDALFRYTPQVELPNRCDSFFSEFCRAPKETLNAYLLRHQQARAKLREAGLEIPDQLAGWHLMSRSAIPKWQEPNLKALCANDMSVSKVSEGLKTMFGGDAVAHPRDVQRVKRANKAGKDGGDAFYATEDQSAWEDNAAYDYEDGYDEEAYETYDYDGYEEEPYEAYYEEDEVPEDLERAADECEEALTSYHEARKKMRELATARGFYPVVALAAEADLPPARAQRAQPAGKGRGKGKCKASGADPGRAKGKGKGKGTGRQPYRPRPTHPDGSPKTTSSGSTQQHGPRFKRRKPEDACMVEVQEDDQIEEIMVAIEAGKGIGDSGATRCVMGLSTWQEWTTVLKQKKLLDKVQKETCERTFRFGNGESLVAKMKVQIPVQIYGKDKTMEIFLVPGSTPLLVSRVCFEEWGLVLDFKAGQVMFRDDPKLGWFDVARSEKGHFILDLLNGFPTLVEDALIEQEEDSYVKYGTDDSYGKHGTKDSYVK